MSKLSNLPKAACKKAVEAFVESVKAALKKGNTVTLTGFGTFKVTTTKERMGVNPATGAKMKIQATKRAKFSPGKNLRESVSSEAKTTKAKK